MLHPRADGEAAPHLDHDETGRTVRRGTYAAVAGGRHLHGVRADQTCPCCPVPAPDQHINPRQRQTSGRYHRPDNRNWAHLVSALETVSGIWFTAYCGSGRDAWIAGIRPSEQPRFLVVPGAIVLEPLGE